jgi:hypothetical protein
MRDGPGFVSGVEGPLVFCLDIMCADGVTVTVVPDAVGPGPGVVQRGPARVVL